MSRKLIRNIDDVTLYETTLSEYFSRIPQVAVVTADEVKKKLAERFAAGEGTPTIVASVRTAGERLFLLDNKTVTTHPSIEIKVNPDDPNSGTTVVSLERISSAPIGSAAYNGYITSADGRKMDLRCGVIAVIAGARAGKSPLVQLVASMIEESYAVERFGEPFAGYGSDPRDLGFRVLAAMARKKAIALDSVKDLLSLADGGAMPSGLQRGILPDMSSWSIAAAELGCTIVTPVNASSNDQKVSDLLKDAFESNVTAVMIPEDLANPVGAKRWLYVTRVAESAPRIEGVFEVRWKDKIPFLAGHDLDPGRESATDKGLEATAATAVEADNDFINNVLRKA